MKTRAMTVATLLLSSLIASSSIAAEVGLVDMARVLKQYDRFTLDWADLKARSTEIASSFQEPTQELKLLQQQYATKGEGTEAQLRLKNEIERKTADLKTAMELQKRRLQREEAELYADTYEEVLEAVRVVAKVKQLDLVLRYQEPGEIDRSSREMIFKNWNRSVLYHRDLDVTDLVVAHLQEASAP